MREPKKVSETLELVQGTIVQGTIVQGTITVAMMKYVINIHELDSSACEKLLLYGNATTHDFIALSALAQNITVP